MSAPNPQPLMDPSLHDPALQGGMLPVAGADPQEELRKQKNMSRAAAITMAVLVHAVILLLAALYIVMAAKEETPSLVMVGDGSDAVVAPDKQEFQTRVQQQQPSPPSSQATQVIAATNVSSPVFVPVVDEVIEDPLDLGKSGIGDGFGSGGIGNGMGGANFLGVAGGGNHVILVIDTSSSMIRLLGPNGLEALRKEYDRTIKALKPSMKFNVVCYADSADAIWEKSVAASTENKNHAIEFFKDYYSSNFNKTRTQTFGNKGEDRKGIKYYPVPPERVKELKGTSGGSRVDLGVVFAMESKPSTIFCLSDGEPSTSKGGSKLSDTAIFKLIRDAYEEIYGGKKLEINTLSIDGQGEAFMKKLAKEFGGKYKDIKSKDLN